MMKLSIVVPIYNIELYLKECLDSLWSAAYQHEYEVLMIDDGSQDQSALICLDFEHKYPNYKYFKKENGGLSETRNFGVKQALGHYIFFIDGDDLLCPKGIEIILKNLNNQDCLVFDMNFYWFESGMSKTVLGYNQKYQDSNIGLLLSTCSACNKVIKKSIIEKFPFPKDINYEDLATMPLIYPALKQVTYLNQSIYIYRQRMGSISYTFNQKNLDVFKALKRILDYYKTQDLFQRYYLELEYMCIEHLMLIGNRRFIKHKSHNYLKDSKEFMNQNFKGFLKNPYFKNMSLNDRIFVYLSSLGSKNLVKLFFKIKQMVKR